MTEEPWGRVDESGAVFVRTADGELKVGEWMAGDPAQGVAYYQRRFATLAVDIDLLEHRMKDANLPVADALAKIGKLRSQVDEPTSVGDLATLRARLDKLVSLVDEQRAKHEAERAASRQRTRDRREALVVEAEQLAQSTHWKASGDRIRAIVEEWTTLPRADRAFDQQMWKRLSQSRTTFERRRRAWFAEREEKRTQAQSAKEKLVRQAESLSASTDWPATAKQFRDLMTSWKAAGQAPRGVDDELWERFRSAQDRFFSGRATAFAERDASLSENLKIKLELVAQAERLVPVTDLSTTKRALRELQEKWAAVGQVPRGDRDSVEQRMQKVEQLVREFEESRWRRSNPEARARASATVDQLTKSLAKLEAQCSAAEAAGDTVQVQQTQEAINARRGWLAQAEQSLLEFSE